MVTAAELAILISLKDSMSGPLKQSQQNVSAFGSAMSEVTKIASGFTLGAAIEKAPGLIMDMVKAATEDAAGQARLKTAVEDTGASYATYAKQIDAVISKGQSLGFTDDQTRSALAILTAQTGNAEEAMKRYALAQDLSRGANIDVVTASRLLGKVTEENVNVLNRYGISVQKGSSETELFAAIQQKFGGQAASFASTTAGQMAVLNDQVHELQESFGKLVIPPIRIALTESSKTIQDLDAIIGDLDRLGTAAAGGKSNWDKFKQGFWEGLANNPTVNPLKAVNSALDSLGLGAKSAALDFSSAGQSMTIFNADLGDLAFKMQAGAHGTDLLNGSMMSMITTALNLGGALVSAGNAATGLITKAEESIASSAHNAEAMDTAWKASLTSQDAVVKAAAEKHFADIQAAADAKQLAADTKAQNEADRAYAETIPGMISELYKQADADGKRKQALAEYNAEMGIATDLEGNAIPTMQELVNQQLDSIDASKREAAATREAYIERGIQVDINGNAVKSFQEMVNEQKASILESQQMAKATAEANRELGIVTDTLDSTTSSVNSLSSSLDKATTGWHQMTDAESQSAAKANAGNSKPGGSTSSGAAASSGGSVAFFSSGYGGGRSSGGTWVPTADGGYYNPSYNGNSYQRSIPAYASGTPFVPRTGLALVHRGERITPAGQNAQGVINLTINVAGSIRSDRELVGVVRDALQGGALRGYVVQA